MLPLANLTTDFLDQKRLEADPLADKAVTFIIKGGFEEHINHIFYQLTRNDSYDPSYFEGLPLEVQNTINNFFESSSKLPDWADPEKIKKGQEVFSLYGPQIFMLLNLKSLPMCYTCANGAMVLYDTGRLMERKGKIDPLVRRLMETAQMVVNVLQPDGLKPRGKGLVTMQKVRLIHASIRFFLKNKKYNPQGWDIEKLGEPINQEDLAGTLMSFSPIILSGLKQLNIQLSPEQINAYSHCWKVVGHQMGIHDDLLSDQFDENWELTCRILKHQAATSVQGKALTDSCLAFVQFMIPGKIFDGIPAFLMWQLFQDVEEACDLRLSEMIGLKEHRTLGDEVVMSFSKILGEGFSLASRSKLIRELTAPINKLLLQGYIKYHNEGKNVRFLIPPSLHGDWGLLEEYQNQSPL